MAVNCGECLMNRAEVVELVNGKCPKCGTDYAATMDAFNVPMPDVGGYRKVNSLGAKRRAEKRDEQNKQR
jgi:hypothetical protein